jgi:hypothetical protein
MNKKLADNRNRGGGKPLTGVRFNARFKPPQGDSAIIRLIPGSYPTFEGGRAPYYEYIEHWSERCKKTFICSRHYKVVDEKLVGTGNCVSCFERNDGAKDISFRPLYAWTLIHLDWFYLIPAYDKDDKPLVYKEDTKYHKKGDPIMNRILCSDAEEDDPKIRKAGYGKVFGKREHWSMGGNHMTALTAKTTDLEKECTCGGKIDIPVWSCSGCDTEVIDVDGDRELWTPKKVRERTNEPFDCKKCDTNDFLLPTYDCDNCNDPDPLRLFDVDLEVRREGEGTKSMLIIGRHTPGKIDDRVKDLVPNRDDLHRVFAGDTSEYQSKHLRVKNPFKDEETRRHVQDYGHERDEQPKDDDIPF